MAREQSGRRLPGLHPLRGGAPAGAISRVSLEPPGAGPADPPLSAGSSVRLDRPAAPSLVWVRCKLSASHPGAGTENGDSMNIDFLLAFAAFGIGIVVGLTGMGGGALMTPVLVLFFGVPPLAAVSSDLVASAIMKPVGSVVHLRRGTVHLGLVKWLCIGSVAGAFSGVLIARSFGRGEDVQNAVRLALGIALLLAAFGLIVRAYIRMVEHARRRDGRAAPLSQERPDVVLRPWPTVILGALGGIVVGLTSVGSGSLIIIPLLV